jgi:hypothetical protein
MDFNAGGVQNNGRVRNVPPPTRGGVSPARRMLRLTEDDSVEQFGLYRSVIDTSSKVESYPTEELR